MLCLKEMTFINRKAVNKDRHKMMIPSGENSNPSIEPSPKTDHNLSFGLLHTKCNNFYCECCLYDFKEESALVEKFD